MATLHRVTGNAGAEIYCGEYFDEQKAKEAYLDEHGEVPNLVVHSTSFDALTAEELRTFIARGNG